MAGSNIDPGAICKRVVAAHHAICELPTPCPLHDARQVVRLGQFSVMRSVERLVIAVIQGVIMGWIMRAMQ